MSAFAGKSEKNPGILWTKRQKHAILIGKFPAKGQSFGEKDMKVYSLCSASFASVCYFLTDDEEKEAVIIDPSASPDAVAAGFGRALPPVSRILLTHAHFDHMLALDAWREKTGAPVLVHPEDAGAFSDSRRNAYRLFFGGDMVFSPPDGSLSSGENIPLGRETLRVLHTPGHTPGSCVFDSGANLFTGDTLFAGGDFGRTDLPGGNAKTLARSLRLLLALPGERRVFPGHGEQTSLFDCRAALRYQAETIL